MSRGGKLEFDVPSMRHGASVAGQLGHAFEESASRVSALPLPEGTPPDIAGDLSAVSATLRHAARSSAAQRQWLRFHAQLALIADGPLAELLALFSPPLVAPFVDIKVNVNKLKKPPKGPPGPDWLWHAGEGAWSGVVALADGGARTATAAVTMANPWLFLIQKQLKDVPVLGKPYQWNVETKAGLEYAVKHPGDFLKLMGKDAIDYNDYKNGDIAKGVGRNLFDALSLLLPASKLGKAATLAKTADKASGGAKIAEAGAAAEKLSAQNSRNALSGWTKRMKQRPGESDADFARRQAAQAEKLTTAEGRLAASKEAAADAKKDLEAAQTKADHARDEVKDLQKEMAKATGEAVNTSDHGVNKELANERREEQEKEKEQPHDHGHSTHHSR